LAQVQVSASGQLLPVGGKSLWDTALSSEPQRLKKLHQVDFHHMPNEHCPEDTPGCSKSHQADHRVVLASDRRPRNYVYNFFTDEDDASKDVTKDRMVKYVHPPKQALWDRAGADRDGETRYRNKLGDNILDIPNNEGWQSGDIHMAMDGRDRMPFSPMYKSKRPTTLLHTQHAAPAKPQGSAKFEAVQQQLRRSLQVAGGAGVGAHGNLQARSKGADAHQLFRKVLGSKAGVKASAVKPKVMTLVVSDDANVLTGKAARGARRVQRKHYFGSSRSDAVSDLDSYFDALDARQKAAHVEAMLGAHHSHGARRV